MTLQENNSLESHWCWIGRLRVRVVLAAFACTRCRRFSKKHKCGSVPEFRNAWKPYPLEDCVACTKSGPPAEGPSATLVRQRKPSEKDPEAGKVSGGNRMAAVEKRLSRTELRKNRSRRKQLLLVAVSHGVETAAELMKVMEAFGVELKRRALYDDLSALVKERWLEREEIQRDKSHHWQKDWEWSYTINPAITERLSDYD